MSGSETRDIIRAHSLHCHQARGHGARALRHEADAGVGADAEESEGGRGQGQPPPVHNFPLRNHLARPSGLHNSQQPLTALIINFNDASPGHRR